jgi:ABC-2 type transport system ATP-binding protein
VTPPILEARDARIGVDGVVAVDGLSVVTRGDRVVVAGDVTALFALLMGVPCAAPAPAYATGVPGDGRASIGEAFLSRGTLLLLGEDVGRGAHVAVCGVANLDPAFVPGWTVAGYVGWGARLAGVRPRDAVGLAHLALQRLGLVPLRDKPLAGLSFAERRAVVLAQAVATEPRVIIVEAPMVGLSGPAATFVLQVLLAAAEGRGLLVSVADLAAHSPQGALARTASHLVVLAAGAVAVDGPPAELFAASRVYALTVRSNAEPFRTELAGRGITLRGGPVRFSAALPPGLAPQQILAAARAARAAVVEMVPVIG